MRVFLLSLSLLLVQWVVLADKNSSRIASVPFEVVGTYVMVKVTINGSSPMNFILDSGLGSTIVTELMAEDSLTLNYSEKTVLKGLGKGVEVEAMISRGNTLQVGRMKFVNQMVHLLTRDVFNLSLYTGTKINGLLGSDFFQDQVVKIDYDAQRITFYESSSYEVPMGFVAIPLTFRNNKMYAKLMVSQGQGKPVEVDMLIDTGAELAAWFRSFGENAINIPEKHLPGYIGHGLNGEIKGYFGRMPKVYFGGHTIHNPIVSFPDSASIGDIIQDIYRDGTVGSQLLSRFNLIFDEPNELLYIKPNHHYKKPFKYNIAGIEVIKQPLLPYLPEIFYVWEGSPAEKAGIMPGDMILNINGRNCFEIDINEVRHLFEKPVKRSLRLTLIRQGKTSEVELDISRTI